jgi:hypothetical protein
MRRRVRAATCRSPSRSPRFQGRPWRCFCPPRRRCSPLACCLLGTCCSAETRRSTRRWGVALRASLDPIIKQGPKSLFCMPNRANCVLLPSAMACHDEASAPFLRGCRCCPLPQAKPASLISTGHGRSCLSIYLNGTRSVLFGNRSWAQLGPCLAPCAGSCSSDALSVCLVCNACLSIWQVQDPVPAMHLGIYIALSALSGLHALSVYLAGAPCLPQQAGRLFTRFAGSCAPLQAELGELSRAANAQYRAILYAFVACHWAVLLAASYICGTQPMHPLALLGIPPDRWTKRTTICENKSRS